MTKCEYIETSMHAFAPPDGGHRHINRNGDDVEVSGVEEPRDPATLWDGVEGPFEGPVARNHIDLEELCCAILYQGDQS